MDPGLLHIFEKMSFNQTPMDLSLQGQELGPVKTGILAKWVGVCTSLFNLDLNRMKIDDEQGRIIAQYVKKSKTLRSLSMEGNMCGPKTAAEFGKTLKTNNILKYLNLEGNQLAAENGADAVGIYEFADFLPHNTTLLSLSIANNQLD